MPAPGEGLVRVDGVELAVAVTGCEGATGLVVFAHASGSGRFAPGHRYVAGVFERAGLCTVQADLLTEEEEIAGDEELPFDLPFLVRRLRAVADWIREQTRLARLPLGYMGSGTGALKALKQP